MIDVKILGGEDQNSRLEELVKDPGLGEAGKLEIYDILRGTDPAALNIDTALRGLEIVRSDIGAKYQQLLSKFNDQALNTEAPEPNVQGRILEDVDPEPTTDRVLDELKALIGRKEPTDNDLKRIAEIFTLVQPDYFSATEDRQSTGKAAFDKIKPHVGEDFRDFRKSQLGLEMETKNEVGQSEERRKGKISSFIDFCIERPILPSGAIGIAAWIATNSYIQTAKLSEAFGMYYKDQAAFLAKTSVGEIAWPIAAAAIGAFLCNRFFKKLR